MQFQVSTFFKVWGVGAFLLIFTLALQAGPASDGGDLFKHQCATCHGADGKGYPALKTPDFTDPKVQASLKNEEIVRIIKNGKKDTAMPPFASSLNAEQIHSLVTYLRSLNSSKKK